MWKRAHPCITQLRQHTDAQLLLQLQRGNRAAIQVLYDRYAATMYQAALLVCQSPPRAEEATIATFLALWEGGMPQGALEGWLIWQVQQQARSATQHTATSMLPPLERQVLEAAQGGMLVGQIAEQARLSAAQVKALLTGALNQLREQSRAQQALLVLPHSAPAHH